MKSFTIELSANQANELGKNEGDEIEIECELDCGSDSLTTTVGDAIQTDRWSWCDVSATYNGKLFDLTEEQEKQIKKKL